MSTTQDLMQELLQGRIGRREIMVRALALGVSLSGVEAILQSCGSGGSGSGSSIRWQNWANTGELARFQAFTANYNKTHNTNVQYIFVPSANGNYWTKLLTELEGGNAPDVFYVGDNNMGQLV